MKTIPAKKIEGRYCCAYGCREKPNPRKAGLCHKHYARKLRAEDPVQVRYNQLVQNAKRRGWGVFFSLNKFRQWCQENGYIVKKGRRGFSATLDRIDPRIGYYIWNLQILTNRANASKGTTIPEDLVELPF